MTHTIESGPVRDLTWGRSAARVFLLPVEGAVIWALWHVFPFPGLRALTPAEILLVVLLVDCLRGPEETTPAPGGFLRRLDRTLFWFTVSRIVIGLPIVALVSAL